MKRALPAVFLFCLIMAPPSAGYAQFYKWEDDRGIIHYTDDPEEAARHNKKNEPVSGNVTVFTNDKPQEPATPSARSGSLLDWFRKSNSGKKARRRQNQKKCAKAWDAVDLYVMDHCRFCEQAQAWLSQNNYRHRVHNVSREKGLVRQMKRKGIPTGSYPVLVSNGVSHKGFSVQKYERIYCR